MTYPYKCCRCRARNTSTRKVNNWLPVRGQKLTDDELTRRLKDEGGMRCRSCGHTSFYLCKYRLMRPVCRCGGYHFTHRPGSPHCEANPRVDINRAKRAGATDDQLDELRLDLAWSGVGAQPATAEAPF